MIGSAFDERAPLPLEPIVHGYPTPETMERAERGEVILGGCDPTFDPEILCPTCGEPVASRVASDDSARELRSVEKG